MIRPTCQSIVSSKRVTTRQVSTLATRWTNWPKRQVYEIIRKDCPSHYVTQALDARSISWHIPTVIRHHEEKERSWLVMCSIVGISTGGAGCILGGFALLLRDSLLFEVVCNYTIWVLLPLNLGCATKIWYHSARLRQLRRLQSEAEQELENMRNRRKLPRDC